MIYMALKMLNFRVAPASLALLFLLSGSGFAQSTTSLTVTVSSPDGQAVSQARVTLENPLTGFHRELIERGAGEFWLAQIPSQGYTLTVRADGFAPDVREVSLRNTLPVSVQVGLRVLSVSENLVIEAESISAMLDAEATGTRTALSAAVLETLPIPAGNRGLETYLLTFPGFAMNANGAIHPRGAHNQMTFVVDGLPINDQLTGAFATALDTNIVDSLELYTGDVPAEFGSKVSGVAAVSTRSGVGSGRKFFGSTQLGGGGFGTVQNVTQAGGEAGRLAYFVSFSGVVTRRFLDAVSLDNLHNGGNSQRGFLRLDYRLSDRDTFFFNAMTGRSSFQLANLRSQQAAGMDQRQTLRDASLWMSWHHVISPSATWETTVGYRPTVAQLIPSAGDTPVTAAQSRHLTTVTVSNRLNWLHGRHNIRAGIDVQHFPVSESFSMGITSAGFNAPESAGFNDSLLPYDLTRGGSPFYFSGKTSGTLYSGFVQNVVKAGRFTVSLGMRYDRYRFLVNGSQWQPRLGVAYHIKETSTVLRASYNRNYQTPPNENLLLSNSPEASRLAPSSVRAALGQTHAPIQPQRENVYEVGLQQSLFGRASVNASFYHKDSVDQQDNNNFFNTGIIFPVALAKIRVNGVEARLTLPRWHGFTGSLSATHARAVSTPPFTGGLFIGQDAIDILAAGPFVIDHDQKLSLQTNVNYSANRNWWSSASIRYDSGLVANPSDPVQVAQDPDYSDLLPYVRLGGTPARVGPRTVTDVSAGYRYWRNDRQVWEAQVQFTNLFNITGLYNFQSVFVGTRVVAPRIASIKVRWFW